MRRQIQSEKRAFLTTSVFYAVVLLVAVGIVIYLNIQMNRKLENRQALLQSIRDEIKTYEISGDFLSKKDLERMTAISTQRIFWTMKLVALSDITTEDIAITHFSFKNNNLSLFGITRVDRDHNEFVLIDNFINQLKADEQISKDFTEIKFVKSNRDKEKDVDILRFQIDCIAREFVEAGGVL
jgi:hypothetical protein